MLVYSSHLILCRILRAGATSLANGQVSSEIHDLRGACSAFSKPMQTSFSSKGFKAIQTLVNVDFFRSDLIIPHRALEPLNTPRNFGIGLVELESITISLQEVGVEGHDTIVVKLCILLFKMLNLVLTDLFDSANAEFS